MDPVNLYCSEPTLILILLETPLRPLQEPYRLLKTVRCTSPHCPMTSYDGSALYDVQHMKLYTHTHTQPTEAHQIADDTKLQAVRYMCNCSFMQ